MSRILLLAAVLLLVCTPLACRQNTDAVWVNTLDALEVTATSATLNGWLDDLDSGSSAEVKFKIWPADHDDQSEVISAGIVWANGSFSLQVNNLDPGTTYIFKALATTNGSLDYGGGERQFTTLAEVISPTVTTGDATDITSDSAILHGAVESMGPASELYVSIEMGSTSGGPYDLIFTGPGTFQSPGSFSVDASGLTPETTYYYRAAGTSISAYVPPGEEKSFKTTKGAELTISSSQMVTEGSTVKVTGQAQNTGTLPLTYALITVDFKDGSGALLASGNAETYSLGLGEVWTWEVTYPLTDISNVASYEAQVAQMLTT